MEYIDGEELNSKHVKQLGIPKIFEILITILNKLCNKNIYHLDIKPENILFNKNTKEIKLADFGLACSRDKMKKNVCGTRGYIAYEVLKDIKISCKSDVFSMGATLYNLLTGKRIYKDYKSFHRNPFPYYEKAVENILNLDIKYLEYGLIIIDMIAIHSEDRPTPLELLERIKKELNEDVVYEKYNIVSYIEMNMEDYDEDFFDSKKEFIEELIKDYIKTRKIKNLENKDIKIIEDKYNIKLTN